MTYEGEGDFSTPGISLDDFSRMQVGRARSTGRHLPTPDWANDNKRTREVICVYLEQRAFSKRMIRNLPQATFDERLARAGSALKARVPALTKSLDSMCQRYVAAKSIGDHAAARRLEIEIRGIDTTIRLYDGGPAFIAGIVYFYYRCRYKSTEIGSELGISSPHVRQVLHRLNRVAQGMTSSYHCKKPPCVTETGVSGPDQ